MAQHIRSTWQSFFPPSVLETIDRRVYEMLSKERERAMPPRYTARPARGPAPPRGYGAPIPSRYAPVGGQVGAVQLIADPALDI